MPAPASSPGGATPHPADDATGALPWIAAEADLEHRPRLGTGRIVLAVLSVLLVAALVAWGLPWVTGAGWSEILTSLSALPAWAVPSVVVLGVLAVALEALTLRTALRGAPYGDTLRAHAAGSAAATAVPGGGLFGPLLLGYLLRRSGLPLRVILTGIVAGSLVELAVASLLVPLLGLTAYAVASLGGVTAVPLPGGIGAALAVIVLGALAVGGMAVLLRRSVLAGLLDQLAAIVPLPAPPGRQETDPATDDPADEGAARPALAEAVLTERDHLVRLLRTRPFGLLLPTAAARTAQWLALVLALQAVGAELPLLLTVAVFALGRVAALLPLTPGGAGIAETVGAAALVGLGVGAGPAATAVLLLGITTWVVPLLGGGIAALLPGRRRG